VHRLAAVANHQNRAGSRQCTQIDGAGGGLGGLGADGQQGLGEADQVGGVRGGGFKVCSSSAAQRGRRDASSSSADSLTLDSPQSPCVISRCGIDAWASSLAGVVVADEEEVIGPVWFRLARLRVVHLRHHDHRHRHHAG
jgi:hypothetical protein